MTRLSFIRNTLLAAFMLGLAPLSSVAQNTDNSPPEDSEFNVQVSPEAAKALREAIGAIEAPTQSQTVDADEHYILGESYRLGRGVEQNYFAAAEEYRKASAQGHFKAMYRLGDLYLDGDGVSEDDRKGVSLIRSAAEGGYTKAQNRMGMLYAFGSADLPELEDEARRWFQIAADNGDQQARLNLADMDDERFRASMADQSSTQSGPSARETGEFIGILLRYLVDKNEASGRSGNNSSSAAGTSVEPEQAVCRAEAAKHITECTQYTDTSNCSMTGCDQKVYCDRRAWCVGYGYGPYGEQGAFYCDIKHRGNYDVDYEVVLNDACNGKF